jgi:hypothetical protein
MNEVMSPLADPVVAAIFNNVENAGQMVKSIVNAVRQNVGSEAIGEVIRVTPQADFLKSCRMVMRKDGSL